MMDDRAFLDELRQIVIRRASAMNYVDTMAFVSEIAERLEEDPVFGEFVQVEYSGQGSRNRQIRIHGFTELDESDGTLGLVIGKWSDSEELETLTTAAANQLSGWLEGFLAESIENELNERITEANRAYELATQLRDFRSQVARIRLHIFSNQQLSNKFKEELCGNVAGIPIERHIWDFQRLKTMYESSREREAVEITLSDFGSDGIPFIEASCTDKLRSFLCVINGTLLADLFERFGSRLLEGNVRSFLGMKGGVNRGIRGTIQDVPSLFFAYNNGIAATAAKVLSEQKDGSNLITGFTDFQIVNGGQTTASILNARKKDHLSLEGVTIQMKLTEVNWEEAHDLIPKIAQFANTQNKVAAADFFANHPFHRKIEEISRRLQVPAKAGLRVQSKWFYERSRGQFQNERLYLAKSKKDAFDLEYPSEQVINKTDLAKYDSAWHEKPHNVSLGAQKNFIKFAGQFTSKKDDMAESEYWVSISPTFSDDYYRRIVGVAILWKRAEKIVSDGRGTWYEGDYRPQIVAYSLSLLFYSCRRAESEFNLLQVWQKQGVDAVVEECIRKMAISVQASILNPPPGTKNVGEWCKKEACWENIKQLQINCSKDLRQWIIGVDEFKKEKTEGRKDGKTDDAIALQKQIFDLAKGGYWLALLKWPKLHSVVPSHEHNLLVRASSLSGFARINVPKDWQTLLDIKRLCEDEGFRP